MVDIVKMVSDFSAYLLLSVEVALRFTGAYEFNRKILVD